MKLVKFSDGTFGVRRGWFFHQFADMYGRNHWWTIPDHVQQFCKGTETRAREVLAYLQSEPLKYEVIK